MFVLKRVASNPGSATLWTRAPTEEIVSVKQVKQDQQRTASPDSSAAEETTVLDGVIHEPHEKALAQHLMKRKKSSLPSSASAPSLLCFAADAYPIAC